jgi:hypothetical protein
MPETRCFTPEACISFLGTLFPNRQLLANLPVQLHRSKQTAFVFLSLCGILILKSTAMASLPLPRVESLLDYTSFELTVLPYLTQLQWLPDSLREAGSDVHSLRAVYLATNPLVSAIAFSGALAGLLFIAAEINRNYSQIDRFWSILPALYNVHFALWARLSGIQTQTLDTIAVVTVVWSVSFAFLSSLYMY